MGSISPKFLRQAQRLLIVPGVHESGTALSPHERRSPPNGQVVEILPLSRGLNPHWASPYLGQLASSIQRLQETTSSRNITHDDHLVEEKKTHTTQGCFG